MKINELKIEGFKSIGEIKLVEPNPFSVFVGPNGAGKSNIFEAIEFMELCEIMEPMEVVKLFGGDSELFNFSNSHASNQNILIDVRLGDNINPFVSYQLNKKNYYSGTVKGFENQNNHDIQTFTNFTRLFISNPSIVKRKLRDSFRLASDALNLEKVLKRILRVENDREEIIEILQLLIPGFSNLEIRSEELSKSDNLVIYDESLQKPLTKWLISDGTYNILAILTAIFQSDEPQFLLIEEPENGLNPKVVRELVTLFRDKCKEKGHYIWLNTHSQTLVSELTTDEIILVDKVNGNTQIKQVKGVDLHGMKMDEALLTNTLGGGIPW
jgi:predicted ATPase